MRQMAIADSWAASRWITLATLCSGISCQVAAPIRRIAISQGEVSVIAGSTPQVSTHYRAGDYSIIGVDPLDECTFLYTQQAHPRSDAGWQTRLGSFQYPNCGQPSANLDATNTPTRWIDNETLSYAVSLTNTGTEVWPAQGKTPVHLGAHFASKGGGYGVSGTGASSGWLTDQRFPLPSAVPPGGTINLTVSVTAPATTGDLVLEYEAVWEGRLWFRQFADVSTTVLAGPVASYLVNATPSSWINSQTQSYTVSVTNTGNQLWPAQGTTPVRLGVHFARKGGGYGVTGSGTGASGGWLTDQRFSLPADVPPGASVNLTISVTAPATATGKLVLEYEVLWEGRFWFSQFADIGTTVRARPRHRRAYCRWPGAD